MKQIVCFLLGTVALCLSSCTNYYKRPIVIDRVSYVNKAGGQYEEKFQQINAWHLQKVDSIQELYAGFVVNTKSPKRHHKMNYTLEALLQPLEVEGKPGLYYNLYLKPNSGIGQLKDGKGMENIYNELKLYTPEENFFRHGQAYYTDSVVPGAFNRIRPMHEWLTPQNADYLVSYALDSLSFPAKFSRRQKDSMRRILYNAFVLKQQESSASRKFNFYPNYLSKNAYTPAANTLNFDIIDSPETNQLIIKIRYKGGSKPLRLNDRLVLNRQDFLKGHYFEAASAIRDLVSLVVTVTYPKVD